ncbi:putative quinol monooxygenase [Sphingobacterium thalpophilum]|uniref:putative quinol monooxygenase n=1 Tax=Sphingobacterium thalpophilum TaxID=259 RepID=UPI0024A744D9|nr:putative quinol monooxygenase [Sphingobacterium thalpophilum]
MKILSIGKYLLCAAALLLAWTQVKAQKIIAGKIAAITEITPKPGEEKAVLEAAKYIQKEASKEPGCLLFSLNTEKDNPGVVVLYEVFKDQTALDRHKKQAHTQHFLASLDGKYADNKVTFLNTINTYYH